MSEIKKQACLRCSALFWDDGNTFCPGCDSACVRARMRYSNAMLPDAPERVYKMRMGYQAELEAQAQGAQKASAVP
jgi:uncharacterized Zn finger protein (UPF0148 family)